MSSCTHLSNNEGQCMSMVFDAKELSVRCDRHTGFCSSIKFYCDCLERALSQDFP